MGKRLRTVKVSEETYKKLKWYRSVMELNMLAEGETASVSMDMVISTLTSLLESAKIKFTPPKKEKATQAPR